MAIRRRRLRLKAVLLLVCCCTFSLVTLIFSSQWNTTDQFYDLNSQATKLSYPNVAVERPEQFWLGSTLERSQNWERFGHGIVSFYFYCILPSKKKTFSFCLRTRNDFLTAMIQRLMEY